MRAVCTLVLALLSATLQILPSATGAGVAINYVD